MTDNQTTATAPDPRLSTTCTFVAMVGVAIGLTLLATNGAMEAVLTLVDWVRLHFVKLALSGGSALALFAFSLACIAWAPLQKAIFVIFSVVMAAVVFGSAAVGWARMLGVAPGGSEPYGLSGAALGALVVALSLVALTWCRTPLVEPDPAERPMHPNSNKTLTSGVVAVMLVWAPGVVAFIADVERPASVIGENVR